MPSSSSQMMMAMGWGESLRCEGGPSLDLMNRHIT